MLKTAILVIALLPVIAAVLRAEEKSDAQRNLEWHLDANGNVDSCKVDIPSPFVRMPPENRAEFDKGVEACHQKKAVAADSEVRRRQDMARQEVAARRAAQRDAEAHRQYLEEHHLTSVSVIDLQANGKDMVGGHVAVTGYVRVLREDMIAIYTSLNDVNGVRLDLSEAKPQSRRRIFGLCSDLYNPCQIEIAGTVDFDEHVLVKVD